MWKVFIVILIVLVLLEDSVTCKRANRNKKKKKQKQKVESDVRKAIVCEDTLSERKLPLFALGKNGKTEPITTCARLTACYPGMCKTHGGENGLCCASCQRLGTAGCMDEASRCTPVTLTHPRGWTSDFQSCQDIASTPMYRGYCSPDNVGGNGKPCCKSCKGLCVDSATWQYAGAECQGCLCEWLDRDTMRKCCQENKPGANSHVTCQKACCRRCQQLESEKPEGDGGDYFHIKNL